MKAAMPVQDVQAAAGGSPAGAAGSMNSINRRQYLSMALGLGAAAVAGRSLAALATAARAPAQPTRRDLQWRERALLGFGTILWLRAAHVDELPLGRALDAAVAAIRHVERQMSLFDENSAVCRLNHDGALRNADPHLLRVLKLATHVATRSSGAFDATMQPLWQAWAAAQREGRLPAAGELRQARARVDWRAVRVAGNDIFLERPAMALSFNGIAQGYAADLVRATLQAHGVEHALLDTGECWPLGRSPQGEPWSIALADPRAFLVSDGRALATSSDAHTAFSADRRHHHIIDPRSGYSPTVWSSVTVAAPSCALADALTKVMFMASAPQALALARNWGVDVLLVDKAGRWRSSSGMPLRRAPAAG